MDPTQARRLRVDRRTDGMRRQRRATQVTVAGAAVAAVAFGWAFAHATGASAGTSDPTQSAQTTTGGDDQSGGALQAPAQAPGSGGSGESDIRSGGS